MIATHSPKMFNARLKSPGFAARISGPVPQGLISSKTVEMRREFWAAPLNAAEIRHWRDVAANLPEDFPLSESLPDINDPMLKQLLLPVDWKNDRYVSVTPVASMGVIHEVFTRLHEQNLPFRKWIIQPTPAAMANHGEALLMQSGAVRMLRRGQKEVTGEKWTGDFVQLTARCESMNISSGMVAVGFPALTAIGGYVHSLERAVGCNIEFAFGMTSVSWASGVPRIAVHKTSGASSVGRVKGRNVEVNPAYSTEEITATGGIVLLLRASEYLDEICDQLRKMNRLAGGLVFDVDVKVVSRGEPPAASYLIDATADISAQCQAEGPDTLQAALQMYGEGGEWLDGKWVQPGNGYTLNQTGYAFLEQPKVRKGVRGNYPHAWAEPVYSLITQGSMTDNCWWSPSATEAGVYWQGNRSRPGCRTAGV